MTNSETRKSFDLIVIGSGPAGEKAAVKAAYFGYKVALIEKENHYGGAGYRQELYLRRRLKETALYLSGVYQKGVFGVDKQLGRQVGVHDFLFRKNVVTSEMHDTVQRNLLLHGITVFKGFACFEDEHHIRIKGENGRNNPQANIS